ncbi:MAG TPA: UDP-N-acetylglucosamine 2-epimerase (non-hydrolyzing) [Gaiellaceae bacterium]|nr:UDP-N-acetylglucosamine 2-epimerase (non-hydrolyzing) [Gaiellaceae bacterium]
MRVLSVVGNRPQFIKSAPLSVALRDAGIDEAVVHTGQHYDRKLSQVFFDELGLGEPENLDLRTADVDEMEPRLEAAIATAEPDAVLVFGDTNSTLAGARAARAVGLPVAHVEAGLRSGDLSMPEEHNRIEVDRIAALLLCPDERSADTLRGEGVSGRIEVVGDVMADASRVFLPLARGRAARPDEPYAVLTVHRQANTEPEQLRRLIEAVNATGWTFVFPVHPRTRLVMDEYDIRLAPAVHAVEPLGYLEMLDLAAGSTRVVTDSGGLQKEAYWLQIPCITLRPSTEWVDTVLVGANTLVDPADPSGLGSALADASFPANAPQLYGDGHASERVAAALLASLGRS